MPNTNAKEERRAPQVPSPRSFDLTQSRRKKERTREWFLYPTSDCERAETHSTMLLVVISEEGDVYSGLCYCRPLADSSASSQLSKLS